MTRLSKAALLCTVVSLGACKKSASTKPAQADAPTRVELVAVASHHFEPAAELSGEIRPANLANLTTQTDGVIVKLTVDEGDRVKAGQLLAVIDDSMARASVERSLASVGVAKAAQRAALVQLDAAKTELVRSEKLYAAKAIDDQTIEAARARVQSLEAQAGTAAAQIHQAQADVNLSATTLAQHRVMAPIDGVVARRYPRLHEYIGKDRPIFDLIDTRAMELVTKVPEEAARSLATGSLLHFEVPSLGGHGYDGKVIAVVPQLDPASRTLRVRARIDNPTGELVDGMYARAKILAGAPHEGPAIPEAALRGEGADRFVWVARDGKAERLAVSLGASDGSLVEIVKGVALGDQVILGGADGLKPGTQVLPGAQAAPAPKPAEAAAPPIRPSQKVGD